MKVKVWVVYDGNSILCSQMSYTVSMDVEGKHIDLNERPPLAIYETKAAAREKARQIHWYMEPAFVKEVEIKL